jgi:hypothetical protein
MKKPYLKKFSEVGDFSVYLVDGKFIRTNLDEEFTNFGQHFRLKFIPKNEFWIDKESSPGEEKYFIDHLLVEYKLMKSGMSYKKAITKAGAVEQSERKKSKKLKPLLKIKNYETLLAKIHKKKLRGYGKDINVWVISGEKVRGLFYIDFTEGGHEFVYNFVPKSEVWIDDDISSKERKFVLLHEIHERNLMAKGMCYDDAHKSSSKIEYHCRRNPRDLNKFLKKELTKYN